MEQEKICTLQNDAICVQVSTLGAELRSLRNKQSGREEIWQRDPSVWRKCAPWLYPIIGQLKDNGFEWNGRRWNPGMHGFASKSVFSVAEETEASLHLVLKSDAETLAIYPWKFELHIVYAISDKSLCINCKVVNCDADEMYFSFGAHPGFICRTGDRLTFEKPEQLLIHRLTADTHLLLPAIRDEKTTMSILLTPELFRNDAMILEGPASRNVTIERADGSKLMYVFPRVPWLGLWTKYSDEIRYICVEPWFGVDDPVDADGQIGHKTGIQKLKPSGVFECAFEMKIAD